MEEEDRSLGIDFAAAMAGWGDGTAPSLVMSSIDPTQSLRLVFDGHKEEEEEEEKREGGGDDCDGMSNNSRCCVCCCVREFRSRDDPRAQRLLLPCDEHQHRRHRPALSRIVSSERLGAPVVNSNSGSFVDHTGNNATTSLISTPRARMTLRRGSGGAISRQSAHVDDRDGGKPLFRILRHIGEGAFGNTFVAERLKSGGGRAGEEMGESESAPHDDDDDGSSHSHYAAKIVRSPTPHILRDLCSEASVLAQVGSHPNIAALRFVLPQHGRLLIFTTLVHGSRENLREVMSAGDDHGHALDFSLQLARGLSHIHARAVLHFDVKPENVVVDGSGRLLIVDFGLARLGAMRISKYQFGCGAAARYHRRSTVGESTCDASDWGTTTLEEAMPKGGGRGANTAPTGLCFRWGEPCGSMRRWTVRCERLNFIFLWVFLVLLVQSLYVYDSTTDGTDGRDLTSYHGGYPLMIGIVFFASCLDMLGLRTVPYVRQRGAKVVHAAMSGGTPCWFSPEMRVAFQRKLFHGKETVLTPAESDNWAWGLITARLFNHTGSLYPGVQFPTEEEEAGGARRSENESPPRELARYLERTLAERVIDRPISLAGAVTLLEHLASRPVSSATSAATTAASSDEGEAAAAEKAGMLVNLANSMWWDLGERLSAVELYWMAFKEQQQYGVMMTLDIWDSIRACAYEHYLRLSRFIWALSPLMFIASILCDFVVWPIAFGTIPNRSWHDIVLAGGRDSLVYGCSATSNSSLCGAEYFCASGGYWGEGQTTSWAGVGVCAPCTECFLYQREPIAYDHSDDDQSLHGACAAVCNPDGVSNAWPAFVFYIAYRIAVLNMFFVGLFLCYTAQCMLVGISAGDPFASRLTRVPLTVTLAALSPFGLLDCGGGIVRKHTVRTGEDELGVRLLDPLSLSRVSSRYSLWRSSPVAVWFKQSLLPLNLSRHDRHYWKMLGSFTCILFVASLFSQAQCWNSLFLAWELPNMIRRCHWKPRLMTWCAAQLCIGVLFDLVANLSFHEPTARHLFYGAPTFSNDGGVG